MSRISISRDGGGVVIGGDVQELAVVHIKPEHTIVIKCKGRVGPEHVEHIQQTLKQFFPDHACLVLLPDMELQIVDRGEAAVKGIEKKDPAP